MGQVWCRILGNKQPKIRPGLTKKLDDVITEYAKDLDYPFESDYDWKDSLYDRETP